MTCSFVTESTLSFVPSRPSKVTALIEKKLAPVIVTLVPPPGLPEEGETFVTTGAGVSR